MHSEPFEGAALRVAREAASLATLLAGGIWTLAWYAGGAVAGSFGGRPGLLFLMLYGNAISAPLLARTALGAREGDSRFGFFSSKAGDWTRVLPVAARWFLLSLPSVGAVIGVFAWAMRRIGQPILGPSAASRVDPSFLPEVLENLRQPLFVGVALAALLFVLLSPPIALAAALRAERIGDFGHLLFWELFRKELRGRMHGVYVAWFGGTVVGFLAGLPIVVLVLTRAPRAAAVLLGIGFVYLTGLSLVLTGLLAGVLVRETDLETAGLPEAGEPRGAAGEAALAARPLLPDARPLVEKLDRELPPGHPARLAELERLRAGWAADPHVLSALAIERRLAGRAAEALVAAREGIRAANARGLRAVALEIFGAFAEEADGLQLPVDLLLAFGEGFVARRDRRLAGRALEIARHRDPADLRPRRALVLLGRALLDDGEDPALAAAAFRLAADGCPAGDPLAGVAAHGLEEAERKLAAAARNPSSREAGKI